MEVTTIIIIGVLVLFLIATCFIFHWALKDSDRYIPLKKKEKNQVIDEICGLAYVNSLLFDEIIKILETDDTEKVKEAMKTLKGIKEERLAKHYDRLYHNIHTIYIP